MAIKAIYTTCCGIDVHKMKLVACLKKGRKQEIREFSAKTKDIRLMADWLEENGCEMIAMESTSVYWKPLVNIFDLRDMDFIVINARDYKNVPGKKTDVEDSEWIASLLQHGLLKSSYIPKREQRELRELTRYRKKMSEERARSLNRLQKFLEGANIKIGSIVSNIEGKTSMSLLDFVLNNDEDITESKARELIVSNIKATVEEVVEAMDGIITPLQRELMLDIMDHISQTTKRLAKLDDMVKMHMKDYHDAVGRLMTIPGVGRTLAEVIIAEIGTNMEQFPTSGHLASWAGISPGNNESAGKRKNGKTTKGNKILKVALVQAANGAKKNRHSFFHAQFNRLVTRRGKKRANVAVGHSILIAIYHMLKNGEDFKDLGAEYYNKFNTEKKAKSYLKKLAALGYEIDLDTIKVELKNSA